MLSIGIISQFSLNSDLNFFFNINVLVKAMVVSFT